jgi:hypothetical protein
MATNNALNLKSSGIVNYDGLGTFTALANPLTIANGGTATTSFTAFAVVCAGTGATTALQSIASVGNLNDVLTSNDAATLPTFQPFTVSNNYSLIFQTGGANNNVSALSTYFIGYGSGITLNDPSTDADKRIYIPKTGHITKIYGTLTVFSSPSSLNALVEIRKNNTTNTTISNTLNYGAGSHTFNNSAINIAVNAGDYITLVFSTSTSSANGLYINATCIIT